MLDNFYIKMQKKIQLIHLMFGVVVFFIFAYTGQVIQKQYSGYLRVEDIGLFKRMTFLAGHIYILFGSLINILLGAYVTINKNSRVKYLQLLGSVLIIVATIFLIISFFNELPTQEMLFPIRRYSVISIAIGIGLHLTHKLYELLFEAYNNR